MLMVALAMYSSMTQLFLYIGGDAAMHSLFVTGYHGI